MPPFTHHIFVCCNQRPPGARCSCDPEGNERLRECFKRELKQRGLGPLVRANKAGCLDQCEQGPTVVIYPQGIWYGGVTCDDVPRILDETIIGGRILEDLHIPDSLLNTKEGRSVARRASSRQDPL